MPGQRVQRVKQQFLWTEEALRQRFSRGKEACLQFTSGVGTFPLEDALGDGGQLSGFLGAQELKRVQWHTTCQQEDLTVRIL